MKKGKGRIIWIVVAAVALGLIVYLNGRLNARAEATAERPEASAAPDATAGQSTKDYFDTYRTDRNDVRDKEIAYLDEIIAAAGSDDETLAEAQQQKLALVSNMEKEFTIETLLKAKGFQDAAVTFHAGSVSVIVEGKELASEEVASILDVVMRESGESAENIRVMTAEGGA